MVQLFSSCPISIRHSIPLIILEIAFLSAIGLLIRRIVSPTIIPYPYPIYTNNDKTDRNKKDKETSVVLAGSYNPPHYGHLAMLSYLSQRYKKVVAIIGVNPNKTYDVTPDVRAAILKEMIQINTIPSNDDQSSKGTNATNQVFSMRNNVEVEVIPYYIWRYAMNEKCNIMFRGVRTWEKDGKDESQLLILNTLGPIVYGPMKWPLPTKFLEGNPKYNHISSTLIRKICGMEIKSGDSNGSEKKDSIRSELSALVPEQVVDKIISAYSKKKI